MSNSQVLNFRTNNIPNPLDIPMRIPPHRRKRQHRVGIEGLIPNPLNPSKNSQYLVGKANSHPCPVLFPVFSAFPRFSLLCSSRPSLSFPLFHGKFRGISWIRTTFWAGCRCWIHNDPTPHSQISSSNSSGSDGSGAPRRTQDQRDPQIPTPFNAKAWNSWNSWNFGILEVGKEFQDHQSKFGLIPIPELSSSRNSLGMGTRKNPILQNHNGGKIPKTPPAHSSLEKFRKQGGLP